MSRVVSLLRSAISVLSVKKVSDERSDMSRIVDELKSEISLDVNDLTVLISRVVSLLRSAISVLNVKKVSEERSDMSRVVAELRSLISRDNSLEVYDDKSLISLDVSDLTVLISRVVSLLRSAISVLSVLNINEDKSLISVLNASLKSTMSVEREL